MNTPRPPLITLRNVCLSRRMFITLLGLMNVTSMYFMRNGFFSAIIYMKCPSNNENIHSSHTLNNIKQNERTNDGLCYSWTANNEATIIAMTFLGFAISQSFSGSLVNWIGGIKLSLICSQTIIALTTVLIPLAANVHWTLLCSMRFLNGFAQGTMWPCVHLTVVYWSPENERSIHFSIMSAGCSLGTFLSTLIAGPICNLNLPLAKLPYLWQTWTSIYFNILAISGVISIVATVLFWSDNPSIDRFISHDEKKYIFEQKVGRPSQKNSKAIPWHCIFTSVAVYTYTVAAIFADLGIFAVWTIIPEYLNQSFDFDPRTLSIVLAMTYLFNIVTSLASGFASSYLTKNGKLTHTSSAKIFHCTACVGAAICLLCMPSLKSSALGAAGSILSLAVAFHGVIYGAGFWLNSSDFAGSYSSVVCACVNSLSNVAGAALNYLTNAIKTSSTNQKSGWTNTMYTFAAFYLFSALVFFLFGSGKLQPWAVVEDEVSSHELEKLRPHHTYRTNEKSLRIVEAKQS